MELELTVRGGKLILFSPVPIPEQNLPKPLVGYAILADHLRYSMNMTRNLEARSKAWWPGVRSWTGASPVSSSAAGAELHLSALRLNDRASKFLVMVFIAVSLLAWRPFAANGQTRDAHADIIERILREARVKDRQGDLAGAIESLGKAIKISPKDASLYLSRGEFEIAKGEFDEALADINHAIEIAPEATEGYSLRAHWKGVRGDFNGAIADCSHIIKMTPEATDGYSLRADYKATKGDFDGAIADASRAIELEPMEQIHYRARGDIKLRKGDLDDAIADYGVAIDLCSTDGDALHLGALYLDRGSAFYLKREWASAIDDFQHYHGSIVLSDSQNDDFTAYAQFYICLIRARQGDERTANEELAAFLEKIAQDKPDEWTSKAGAFLLNKLTEAELFDTAKSSDATKDRNRVLRAFYLAGMKRLLKGDKTGAAEDFKKCLAEGEKKMGRNEKDYQFAEAELKALGK